MVTEDETFRRLRRPTVEQLRELWRSQGNTRYQDKPLDFLERNGWTVDEYTAAKREKAKRYE